MAENPPRITPPQGNPGRTSLDEGLYVFRVVLLAGPALIMAWQAIRLAVPIGVPGGSKLVCVGVP